MSVQSLPPIFLLLFFVLQSHILKANSNIASTQASNLVKQGEMDLTASNLNGAMNSFLLAQETYRKLGNQEGEMQATFYLCYTYHRLSLSDRLDSAIAEVRLLEANISDSVTVYQQLILGMYEWNQGKMDDALSLFETAYSNSESVEMSLESSYSQHYLAMIYQKKGEKVKALKALNRQLELKELIGDQFGILNAKMDLGFFYGKHGDIARSNTYLREVELANKSIQNMHIEAKVLHFMAQNFKYMEQFDLAMEYYQRTLVLVQKYEMGQYVESINLSQLGHVCYRLGKIDEAYHYLMLAQKVGDNRLPPRYNCSQSIQLGFIHLQRGEIEIALDYANKADQINLQLMDLDAMAKAELLRSRICEHQHNYVQSLEHYKRHAHFRDSLSQAETRKRMDLYTSQLQLKEQELELALQQEEILSLETAQQKQQLWFGSLGFGLFVVFMLLGYGFRVYRQRNQAKIVETQSRLRNTEEELESIRKRIASNMKEQFNPALNEEKTSHASEVLGELLTFRELEVLMVLTQGKTNKQIAEELFISINTVRTHLLNIYDKLEVSNRTQAVQKALSLGLIKS